VDDDRPKLPRQRLFFALWPPVGLAKQLSRTARSGFDASRARLLQPGLLHLTLIYLGPSDAAQRQCAESVADRISIPGFDLVLSKLGFWSRPQVGWIAPQHIPPALTMLIEQLQQGLVSCGFPPAERPWQPHLTLLRKLRQPPLIDVAPEPHAWAINEFVLVESRTLPDGAEYRVLRRWPLAAAAISPFPSADA
jgi:2'-5' RNA ligase